MLSDEFTHNKILHLTYYPYSNMCVKCGEVISNKSKIHITTSYEPGWEIELYGTNCMNPLAKILDIQES